MDSGISELDFWEMTPGEASRSIASRNRIRKLEAQEKASYDYIQAQLIVKGVGIVLGAKEPFPQIADVYPGLFDDIQKAQEEKIRKQKDDLSALRFKQFAQSYNSNFKNKEVPKKINE